jgi:hypothetical protein
MSRLKKKKTLFLLLVLIIAGFLLYPKVSRLPLMMRTTDHHVYVAVGFHANLYHSYRIDTNDEAGFGKDIRIIRHVIDTLDQANKNGVPVRGVWDIENLFTLEEVLPQYAPDIIENIKRRTKESQDEIIVMSYNNSLASALTKREFEQSIRLAISNPAGSGLKDVFGDISPIVRPQEMMITPGNYKLYEDLGIEAVVLYYSAITFDAFRLFVPPLSKEQAFNPLTYHNPDTNEELTVIPAYMIGDLIENVSLRSMAEDLHDEQLRGNIKKDVLIFINFDADDPYWYGYDLPAHLAWLPNTGGLEALINEVTDLDYVRFTNLAKYLEGHPPTDRISFTQDLADGNFDGYNSWSEKATSHGTWTKVMRDRRNHDLVSKISNAAGLGALKPDTQALLDASFKKRLRLLSTTNFGMAAPFLARSREAVADALADEMLDSSENARKDAETLARERLLDIEVELLPGLRPLGGYYLFQPRQANDFGFICLNVKDHNLKPDEALYIKPDNGPVAVPVISRSLDGKNGMTAARLFLTDPGLLKEGLYRVYAGPKPPKAESQTPPPSATPKILKNEFIEVRFGDDGLVEGVYFNGKRFLNPGSLTPQVHLRSGETGKIHSPEKLTLTVEAAGESGVARVLLSGSFDLDGVQGSAPGQIEYRLSLYSGIPYLYIEGGLAYPETERTKVRSGGEASLARKYDPRWYETAPAPLILSTTADREHPFVVHKNNFLGIESSYAIDYFQHHDLNLNLANVNNHITPEYVAVSGLEGGVAVAMDTTVLANFAFCPLKMEYDITSERLRLSMNPFGTYFGPQPYQPTWGNGNGFTAAIMSGQQYVSSAPTYNGYHHEFSLMVGFYQDKKPPEQLRKDLSAFASPPLVVTDESLANGKITNRIPEKLSPPAGFLSVAGSEGQYFIWEKARGNPAEYRLSYGLEQGKYDHTLTVSGTSAIVTGLESGRTYYATVTSMAEDGTESMASAEIVFTAGEGPAKDKLDLPVWLQLKILLASVWEMLD